MKPILILLPTLNRPSQVCDCIASFVKEGTGQFDLLTIGGPGGVISAFNSAPRELIAQYQIIGLMGDDVRMKTRGWDMMIQVLLANKSGLIYGRDGYQNEKLCTHPFITTDIVLDLGFIYPPCLHHFFGDNFYMDLLSPLRRILYEPILFTDHLHPDAGKCRTDATYEASRKWFDADAKRYHAYSREQLAFDRGRLIK